MLIEIRVEIDGNKVASMQGDVSEPGDLDRLFAILKEEFCKAFPGDSPWDYDVRFDGPSHISKS